MAEDETPVASLPLTKVLDLGDNVNNPSTSFNFTVAPYTNTTVLPTGATNYPADEIYAGVPGGISTPTAVTSAAAAAANGATQNLTLDASVFTEPGVYRYEIAETNGGVPGMAYDDSTHVVDLYVDWNASGDLQVSNVIVSRPNGAKEGDAYSGGANFKGVGFKNTYASSDADPTDPDYPGALHDVSVTKSVTGNQGDTSKDFTFTVSYNHPNNINLKYTKDNGATWADIANGGEITLKDGETFKLGGLPAGTKYTIVETGAEGYTSQIVGDVQKAQGASGAGISTGEQTMGTANVGMTVINSRSGSIPTGIFINYKAYWILGGAALVLAFGLTRRRGLREEL